MYFFVSTYRKIQGLDFQTYVEHFKFKTLSLGQEITGNSC